MSNIIIDSAFDSGNIDVMTVNEARAMLRLKNDKDSEFKQWFHFRVANCGGRELVLKIAGLNDTAYPAGWPDYNACVSEDRDFWGRAPSTFDKDEEGGDDDAVGDGAGDGARRAQAVRRRSAG